MFVKLFAQIFDSSIAEDWQTRHVFMDLLVLADADGVIDKTLNAISRRTGVPVEIVSDAMAKLSLPDPDSRSDAEDGRRLVLLSPTRHWGWRVVNYESYRQIRDEEARRAYFRDYKRQSRAQKSNLSKLVVDIPHLSTQVEEEKESETKWRKKKSLLPTREDDSPILPEMLAQKVLSECGISGRELMAVVTDVAKLEFSRGTNADELAVRLVNAWQQFLQAKPKLHYAPGGVKFFGEGMWRDSATWPWKEGASPPLKRIYATVEP